MREAECREGREAREKFEEGMKAIFQVPKDAILPNKTLLYANPIHSDKD